MEGPPTAAVGVFGKLPALGDFIDRGLPRELTDAWHRWLVAGLADARRALGAAFERAYMTAPVWRFVVPAGTLATGGQAGVMLPSVDTAGRLFPLTLAAALTAEAPDLLDQGPWFDALEAAGRQGLALDGRPEGWIAGLADLPPPTGTRPVASGWIGLDPTGADLAQGVRTGLGRLAAQGRTLFWSQGSPFVRPSAWIADRLPEGDEFARLLADREHHAGPAR